MHTDIIGVVIGRFQVDDLHAGHRFLINEAFKNHKQVIIFIGVPQIEGTKHDPMNYPTRERMLRAAYPDAIVLPQKDQQDDQVWSNNLDRQIDYVLPGVKARLYGGRDSFQPHYKGKHQVVEVQSPIEYQRSGTKQREEVARIVRSSADFRAGVIYATQHTWPYVMACVDIACVKQKRSEIIKDKVSIVLPGHEVLMGRKECETQWRLPGGKVDKEDKSLRAAAAREFYEEAGLTPGEATFEYVDSIPCGDWRFKNAGEISLITSLFYVPYVMDIPKAGDDLVEVQWMDLDKAEEVAVKNHKILIRLVREHLKSKSQG